MQWADGRFGNFVPLIYAMQLPQFSLFSDIGSVCRTGGQRSGVARQVLQYVGYYFNRAVTCYYLQGCDMLLFTAGCDMLLFTAGCDMLLFTGL